MKRPIIAAAIVVGCVAVALAINPPWLANADTGTSVRPAAGNACPPGCVEGCRGQCGERCTGQCGDCAGACKCSKDCPCGPDCKCDGCDGKCDGRCAGKCGSDCASRCGGKATAGHGRCCGRESDGAAAMSGCGWRQGCRQQAGDRGE